MAGEIITITTRSYLLPDGTKVYTGFGDDAYAGPVSEEEILLGGDGSLLDLLDGVPVDSRKSIRTDFGE